MEPTINAKASVRVLLFIAVNLVFSALPIVLMLLQDRIPSTHDTFQYLQLQYNYYNEAASKGSFPFWIPFVAHGENIAHLFPLQLSPFSPVQLLLGWLGVKINFLWLFFLGVWFDLFLFQTGIFLLCRKYFRRIETSVYVSVVLLGGIVWSCQIWWNLHQIYFVPALLFCIHEAIDTKQWKWFAGFLLFYFLGGNTQITYNIIFTSFAVTVYFLTILPRHRNDFIALCKNTLKPVPLLALGLLAVLFAASFLNVTEGLKSLEIAGRQRDASGGVSLYTFMSYGGSIGYEKFKDFLFRTPLTHDMTLYAGTAMIPLIIIAAIWSREKYVKCLLVVSLALFLFCAGTTLTKAAFYLFPGFKYFRHIGLTTPMLKLFLVFLSGFGFEVLIERRERLRGMLVLIIAYCALVAGLLLHQGTDPHWDVTLAVTVAATLVVSIAALFVQSIRNRYYLLLVLIAVLDFAAYQYEFQVMTVPVASSGYVGLFRPYDYGFQSSRDQWNNDRYAKFANSPHSWRGNNRLALYNSTDWSMYFDSLYSQFGEQPTEKPVSELLNYRGNNSSRFITELERNSVLSSLSSPKLKIYESIYQADNNDYILGQIFENGAGSSKLFTTSVNSAPVPPVNHALSTSYQLQVKQFSSNKMIVEVDTPLHPSSGREFYLYYADAFNPSWRAKVNGASVPIMKANIAYKAVAIPPGKSIVEFVFFNPVMFVSTCIAILFVVAGFFLTIFLFISLRKPKLSC